MIRPVLSYVAASWRQFKIVPVVRRCSWLAVWALGSSWLPHAHYTRLFCLPRACSSWLECSSSSYFAVIISVRLFAIRLNVNACPSFLFLCSGCRDVLVRLRAGRFVDEPVCPRPDRPAIFGTEITAGTLQVINPIFIILLAPVMGMLWVRLGARNPSIPAKFGARLDPAGRWIPGDGVGVDVAGEWQGRHGVARGNLFLPHSRRTVPSPVGLSSVTKLAPDRLMGQMMGTWFMGAALGNLVAGLVTRYMPEVGTVEAAVANGVQLFGTVAALAIVAGMVFIVFSGRFAK